MASGDDWRDREYVGRPGLSPVLAGLVAAGVLSPGLDVLDVGCGRGADALPLAALGVRVTGVDVNARSVAHARRRAKALRLHDRAAFHVADATKRLPFRAASFDAALDTLLVNNLDDDELPPYAAEVARVLRKGGTLVLQQKVERHAATWHPHGVPAAFEERFEFGLPVHTQLAEGGRGHRARAVGVAVMVGTRRR